MEIGGRQGQAEDMQRPAEGETGHAHRVDQVHALRAVGEIEWRVQVVHENADDLAEAKGDDGQVIAAQSQCGRPQQHTEQAGEGGADGQHRPERQMQAEMRAGQPGIEIGAERVEGDVAEIEQTGIADHDVQPDGQQHIEQNEIQHP